MGDERPATWTIPALARFFRMLDDVDQHDGFWWRANEPQYEPFKILVNCNDLFWWACADCEEVTPDSLDVLERSLKDVSELAERHWTWSRAVRDGKAKRDDHNAPPYIAISWGLQLFCCRVRNMRPQGAWYDSFPPELTALFDAAGPSRDGDKFDTQRRPYTGALRDPETPETAAPWRCPACRVSPHAEATKR